MTNTQLLRVWPGERKLIPLGGHKRYRLFCESGVGHLRLMDQAQRQLINRGDAVELNGRQIATLSGIETMSVVISENI